MSDFARFLPLNGRPQGAETGVSSDRRTALAELVERAAELVAGVASERGVATDTLVEAFIDNAELRSDFDAVGPGPAALGALAAAVRDGRRRRIRALSAGARALLLLQRELDAESHLDAGVAGTVALHLAASAPFARRAAVKGHTIRATDADWSFGSGPVLEGTATAIAAFLLGVSDDPPRPPAVTGRG
ncbi:hypothetical protein ACFXQA_01055 [Microbacterium sp. P07]|uniref:hypothetical protein n=1 Tax=Microbacterium sp. P07 TaxID=3366952 RepID=UPI003744BD00